MGIIESVSEGMSLVRRRPWLIALPVLVDLGIWLAPQLSIEPLTSAMARAFQSSAAASPQASQSVDAARQFLAAFGKDANLFGLLSSGLLGVPSVVAGGMPAGLANAGGAVAVANPYLAVGLALLFMVAGLLVAALYLTSVAATVRGDATPPRGLLPRARRTWLKLIALALALVVAAIAISVPVSLSLTLVTLVSPTAAAFLASLLGLFGLWVGLWVVFYLFFVVDSLVLQEVGLQRAVVNSIVVVRSSFWSTFGFIVLVNVIVAGLSVVWQWLARFTLVGLAVAIAANAFIGSGLVAASLLFYRDRYEAWRARVLEMGGK